MTCAFEAPKSRLLLVHAAARYPDVARVLCSACALLATLLLSCNDAPQPEPGSDATDGAVVAPDYEVAFATDVVHELHIAIAPADFQSMQDNLAELRPRRGPDEEGADAGPFGGEFQVGGVRDLVAPDGGVGGPIANANGPSVAGGPVLIAHILSRHARVEAALAAP
jgi:hypothetical protein